MGYALTDSPIGLLAWIYEKMRNWTDDYPWTDDESKQLVDMKVCLYAHNLAVLTWVTLYWFSRAGPAASVRIYYEFENRRGVLPKSNTLIGLSYFPQDIWVLPQMYVLPRNKFLRQPLIVQCFQL